MCGIDCSSHSSRDPIIQLSISSITLHQQGRRRRKSLVTGMEKAQLNSLAFLPINEFKEKVLFVLLALRHRRQEAKANRNDVIGQAFLTFQ